MAELSVKLLDNLVNKKNKRIAHEKNRLNVYRPIMNNYLIMKVKIVYSFGQPDLCNPPWTAVHQASPSMEFSRQEYWSDLPPPTPTIVELTISPQIIYSFNKCVMGTTCSGCGDRNSANK